LYLVYSLSRLCCCCCIMVGSTHRRTQGPASRSKKVVRECATSTCRMFSISGPATTRRWSYSVYVFPGAVGRVQSYRGSAVTRSRKCFMGWWLCVAYSSWVCFVCCICVWISRCLAWMPMLFNHSNIGIWSLYLYHGSSFSWLCCCYCIMAWSTHGRTQRPATHSKRAVRRCATSNRQMCVISGRAITRCGSYSVSLFPGAVGGTRSSE